MLNKGTASLEVSRSREQRAEPRVREFREFGTASLRGITVLLNDGGKSCLKLVLRLYLVGQLSFNDSKDFGTYLFIWKQLFS